MILSEAKIKLIENQIEEQQKTVDFDTREFTIEILVQKYLNDLESDDNELYVPEYQREFVWDDERQSRLIESIILGLPIPVIFVAENKDGRLEIVDGSQRIRTLSAFLSDDLELSDLEKLKELNGIIFSQLPKSRQRKINNTPIRMIVLSDAATEQVKNDLFERINRGSDILRNMEKRKGIYRGDFNKFIYKDCAKEELLEKLAPLALVVENRQEHEELILRYFALLENYPKFSTQKRGIGAFLDEYMENKNLKFSKENQEMMKKDYISMLRFVDKYFPFGFSKWSGQGVSRVFFESISVGVHFALKEKPDLQLKTKVNISDWLNDKDFRPLVSGKYKTHSPEKIKSRIDYVKNKLLELSL